MKETIEVWLKTRPECVQKLAAEFPPGKPLDVRGRTFYVLWLDGK